MPEKYGKDTAEFLSEHDRIHVIFGCDTSLLDEAKADLWTMLGSSLGIFGYLRILVSPEIREFYSDLKEQLLSSSSDPSNSNHAKFQIKGSLWAMMALPVKIFARTRAMKAKWPWMHSDQFLDRPLTDIRSELNIKVMG